MVGRNENLRGCLLGLAVGDAMGYTVDNKSWAEICENYGPNGLLGYDLANGSADVTSYTQLAAFVCNGILLAETRRNVGLYSRFVTMAILEWAKSQQFRSKPERTNCWVAQVGAMRRRHCMDTRMLDALSRPVLGTPEKPVFVSDTPGALTTAVAIGLCYDPEKMEAAQVGRLAAEAAALTHGDPVSMICSAFLAYSIAAILQEPDKHLSRHFAESCEAIAQQFSQQHPQAVEHICNKVNYALSLTRDPDLTPFAAMFLTSIPASCVACNQTLAIMLTQQLCKDVEPDEGSLAIDLSDSAVVIPPLVPWSIAGAVPLAGAGAPTISILASFYLYLLPLTRLAGSFLAKKRKKV